MINWDLILPNLLIEYPQLETERISFGCSSCRYFILPSGFRDIGYSLVFGDVVWGGDVNDAKAVFAQLEILAQARGIKRIVGPLDFSTYFDYRLRLDFFDDKSFVGEPDNNQNAISILDSLNFKIEKKFYSHEFRVRWNFKFLFFVNILGFIAKRKSASEIQLLKLSQLNYLDYLEEIYELTHSVFSNNYLYQKIPFSCFQVLFEKKFLPTIDSEASILAVNRSGELIGYSLCLKDESNPNRLLFKTIGVKKKYRNGGLIGRQLMREVYLAARRNYKTCLACLMIEGNRPELLFRNASFFSKSYGLFSKELI